MTYPIEKQLAEIKEIFPSNITSVRLHDGGDDFIVIEINRDWMFRFPRREISRNALIVEKAFLAEFKRISPVPVPDHQYQGNDFVGYPKIRGESLGLELYQNLSPKCRGRIAQQIGQFLSAVHTFPIDEAKQMGMIEGWNGWFDKGIQNLREVVLPKLAATTQRNALATIDRLLAEPFDPKVIHGDFALEDHVFFDDQRIELSGVIDFADVTINDPAHDFQNIVEYGGEEFFAAVMENYHTTDDPTLLRRIINRIDSRPLFEASFSHLFGFEKRFKERMEYIETKYGI